MADQPTRHLYCPHCGYNLTGLDESRCPECGGEFDRAELARKPIVLPITIGRALLRMLWFPAASTLLGVCVGSTLDTKAGGLGALLGLILGGALFVTAIVTSRNLSRRLAVNRAAHLGIAPFGPDNRPFMRMSAFGLFCCQGILSAGGFFGGCACLALQHLNVH